ncbi:hypothetical protein [Legionella worsleiensis]|uniref:Uncharacterized protein n=1 Tax=Legionella worsleiensis TaxID=45076 RepID=A0A0W1A3X1_9GAMM|nr:hypothetical protein [Legionella worsleiensis]KTD75976.1 hypothetical protein Lwor_2542 [Legionella worsleiensis]STY32989.1 Uncharacterised protein [Legionella worsleiensis]
MKIIQIKRAASGALEPLTDRVYFPRSEFHCRYPALWPMMDYVRWSTYHRSDFKKLEGVSSDEFKFFGNQTQLKRGMYPKIGNFYNPFHFKAYQDALKPVVHPLATAEAAVWYNRLLARQKKMAAYVVAKVKERDPDYSINADNDYTCVLFSLPKPPAEKNVTTWSHLLSAYLVALTNTLAHERGVNVEMVHRSSFGCLRPSIADCAESVRINLGLTPKEYADCVVDALFLLQRVILNQQSFQIPFESAKLAKSLVSYSKIKTQENERKHEIASSSSSSASSSKKMKSKKVDIHLQDTLWDTLWAPCDSSSKSFASQIFRKSVVKEYLVDLIQQGCQKYSSERLISDSKAFNESFVNPLIKVLKCFRLNKTAISVQVSTAQLSSFAWGDAQQIVDDEFWVLVHEMAEHLGATSEDIETYINGHRMDHIHSFFEMLLANFIFQPVSNPQVEDGCGSDSDEEDDLTIGRRTQRVYAKKIITATGMRALQLIHAASRKYLHDTYKIDIQNMSFSASQMYYETDMALGSYSIPLTSEETKVRKRLPNNVCFFDLNHCNTTQEDMVNAIDFIDKKDKICAVDVTSATTREIHDILVSLFKYRPKLEIILTISSGLKNEQAMADYNPYGTVRIFAKSRESLDRIYDTLLDFEQTAGYRHSKESHLIRKSAKLAGLTPTNETILSGTRPA